MVEFGTYYPQYNVSFTAGDVFRVSVESGVVKYKKNGVVYHTSPGILTYPLKVDSALYTTNSTLTNAVVGGNWSGGSGGSSSSEVLWLVADHLGTPRMILDQTGALANIKRHDYLPFGEELFAGTGGRTTAQGYTASDNVRQKFTSKERDNETGLDYFLARYYSSTQGRFTAPDHVEGNPATFVNTTDMSGALPYSSLLDPQSFNSYSYVSNSPLNFIDEDGHKKAKAPVPVLDSNGKKTGYHMRVEGGTYDSYNIHVYDPRGRQVGRFSLKPKNVGWTDAKKLPSRIQQLVENYAVKRWGAEAVAKGLSGSAYAESYEAREAGRTQGIKGRGLKAVGILMLSQIAVGLIGQSQDAKHEGHYYDFFGRLIITNLELAARNLPRGTGLYYAGFYFVNTGRIWISPDSNCFLCRLETDEKGKPRIVGGDRCCDE